MAKTTYRRLEQAGWALDQLTGEKLPIVEVALPLARIALALKGEREILGKLRQEVNNRHVAKDKDGRPVRAGQRADGSIGMVIEDPVAFNVATDALLATEVELPDFNPLPLSALVALGKKDKPYEIETVVLAPLLDLGIVVASD